MICRHASLLLHCLNRFTSSWPREPSLWWLRNNTMSLGVTCGEIDVIVSGLILENRTKASIGRYIESRGAHSIILTTNGTAFTRLSWITGLPSFLSLRMKRIRVFRAINCTDFSLPSYSKATDVKERTCSAYCLPWASCIRISSLEAKAHQIDRPISSP